MPYNAPRGYLYLLVFVAGFTTLGVELAASRLLDPWFGNSLIVWAALIGMILLYLSLGYWLGGRLADRSPRLVTLLRLTGVGAFGVGLTPIIAHPVLSAASEGLRNLDAGLLAGSMVAVLALFAIPVTLLGCVSPFAIRLGIRDVQGSGEVAGRLYALSTGGSILGSFLPVLFLIPTIGTRRTFATLAATLLVVVVAGLLRDCRHWDALAGVVALALVLWIGFAPAGPVKAAPGLVYETESAFNYIQVVQDGTERQLRLNEGEGIHSVYRPEGGRAYGIWDYFLLAPAFNPAPFGPHRVGRVYIAGLAAGTVAQLYTTAYGAIPIDGAELDPAIIATGRQYFAMNEPNLNAVAEDGRRYLENQRAAQPAPPPYDVIVVDTYRPPYIPFHLTTVEFFTLARDRLSENGVVSVNVGRTHTDYSLVDAIAKTMAQVFPSVFIVDEPDNGSQLGNSMVVGTRRPSTLADFRANLPAYSHPLLAEIAAEAAPGAQLAAPPPGTPIFTDDRAPVEQVVHNLVIREMLGGQ
jgi:predicted membrane-bound spermidine synthase